MIPKLEFGTVPRGPIRSWKQLTKYFAKRHDKWGWIFRGHSDAGWPLQSSLERAVLGLTLASPSKRIADGRAVLSTGLMDHGAKYSVLKLEAGLLRQFKRQCHHHTRQTPEPRDTLEWLALMQHYGAPTRLLDWTYSFYAAVFFAVDGALERKAGDSCCVWAINADWLRDRFRDRHPALWATINRDKNLHKFKETFDNVFANYGAFVCPVSPYRLNDRLVIQQGVFLCPGDISRPFEDNLVELQIKRKERGSFRLLPDATRNVVRIDISAAARTRTDVLRHLHRMNMTPASLFPGLGGFAQSLKNLMVFPKLLRSGPEYD